MNYAHNSLVGDEDLEPHLDKLLALPDVGTVHVRTVLPQCFLYAVTCLAHRVGRGGTKSRHETSEESSPTSRRVS